MRVVLIKTCSHCHVDGCVFRQPCGIIPDECPLDTPEDVIRSYRIMVELAEDCGESDISIQEETSEDS